MGIQTLIHSVPVAFIKPYKSNSRCSRKRNSVQVEQVPSFSVIAGEHLGEMHKSQMFRLL